MVSDEESADGDAVGVQLLISESVTLQQLTADWWWVLSWKMRI
jgi:hypothetical protein